MSKPPANFEINAPFVELNTFNIQGKSQYLAKVHDETELLSAIAFAQQQGLPSIVLGGGSNVLMTKDINGVLIHIAIPGMSAFDETAQQVYLRIGAGVNWHDVVLHCLQQKYYGIENLSLIPGTVGAAPIQNIGAYGVELKDVFHELQAVDLATNQRVTFNHQQCQFAYRQSIFKTLPDRYIVTSVILRLNKTPKVVLTDKSVQAELEKLQLSSPTPQQLSDIICTIRRRKLPYNRAIGNAGSFFTNPFTSVENFAQIKKDFPDAIGFPTTTGLVKVGAGWMIDKCGWKGFRDGDVGVYEHNALVLVNYGNATGSEILNLAEKIKTSVRERFNITLEMEPRVY